MKKVKIMNWNQDSHNQLNSRANCLSDKLPPLWPNKMNGRLEISIQYGNSICLENQQTKDELDV